MARDFFGIPATSTPTERMFSRAGEIYTSHRKCLKEDAVCALLNLGSWWGGSGLPGVNAPVVLNVNYGQQLNVSVPVLIQDKNGGGFIIRYTQKDMKISDTALENAAADEGEGLEDTVVGENTRMVPLTDDQTTDDILGEGVYGDDDTHISAIENESEVEEEQWDDLDLYS